MTDHAEPEWICACCERRVYEAKVYSDGRVLCRSCFTRKPQPEESAQ